jgi:hydrogenase maturation protease HycI
MGIGNPLRTDDAVGVEVVKQLSGKVLGSVKLFNCEMVPENFLAEIEDYQPTHVLMIDAAELKVKPGEARLIPPEKIADTIIFTHTVPLSLLAGVIQKETKSKIILLGIQPCNTGFGEGMSTELQKTTKNIAKTILEAIWDALTNPR